MLARKKGASMFTSLPLPSVPVAKHARSFLSGEHGQSSQPRPKAAVGEHVTEASEGKERQKRLISTQTGYFMPESDTKRLLSSHLRHLEGKIVESRCAANNINATERDFSCKLSCFVYTASIQNFLRSGFRFH
jgi:hypothetical protein